MRITKEKDVKINDYITYETKLGRTVVKVQSINFISNVYEITATKMHAKTPNTVLIRDLFKCPTDEAFTTYDEIKILYPECFI